MSSFHVPSVPRGMLLPGFDTHPVVDEEEDLADPAPPGSHWLFRPPPFISWADLYSETVTIHNPAAWRATSLKGYSISDRLKKHTYSFSEDCFLPAGRSITLHCCPGKLSGGELQALPRTTLLWKNQDGSLRKKEVLFDSGDVVVLYDSRGKEVAMLDIPGVGKEGAGGGGNGAGVAYRKLPGVKRSQVLALRTLVLTLCYLRLGCIGVAASRVVVNPDIFVLFTVLAYALDVLGRWASRQPGVPMDDFGVVLATMGDRLSALVLLGSLVLLDKDNRHRQIFAGMLALDITVNWLQLSVASTAGGPRPLAGGAFVRGRGAAPDFATHLMLRHPSALTLVSLGNEAFLMWSYIVASSPLAHGLMPMIRGLGCYLSGWLDFVQEESSPVYSLYSYYCDAAGEEFSAPNGNLEVLMDSNGGGGFPIASEASSEFNAGGHGGEGSGGMALAWKSIWMTLMICCAFRQLLSCIQALISLSSLSSGVISDAAGQDMQRRRSTPGRGRAVAALANGSSSGGSARRRSSSRPR